MFNFKIFLLLLILPISYLVYHLVGFDRGINAYYEKAKQSFNESESFCGISKDNTIIGS